MAGATGTPKESRANQSLLLPAGSRRNRAQFCGALRRPTRIHCEYERRPLVSSSRLDYDWGRVFEEVSFVGALGDRVRIRFSPVSRQAPTHEAKVRGRVAARELRLGVEMGVPGAVVALQQLHQLMIGHTPLFVERAWAETRGVKSSNRCATLDTPSLTKSRSWLGSHGRSKGWRSTAILGRSTISRGRASSRSAASRRHTTSTRRPSARAHPIPEEEGDESPPFTPRSLDLVLGQAFEQINGAEGLTRLHLPTSAGKFPYLELVARLSVAGALEADVTQNDVLDALVRIEPVQPYPFSL